MRRPATTARTAAGALLLAYSLIVGSGASDGAPAARAAATPVPRAAEVDPDSVAAMLGRLPDLPLGQDGAMVTYADAAGQTAAIGIAPPEDAADAERRQRWAAAVGQLSLPQATAQFWHLPEWREAYGFDLFQVAAAADYAAPPFGLTVLRGTFDPAALRTAWERAGYRPIDLLPGAGEAYVVREDYEVDVADPGSRMALGYLNVVAIAADGSLVFGSARDGVRAALAAVAGQEPSFADQADVAPLIRAAPPDLVSALLMPGEALRAEPDPAGAVLGEESLETFATRVTAEQAEARRLPPVATALLGQTAGLIPTGEAIATPVAAPAAPAARLVVALTTLSPAAEDAAAVIAERLATQGVPASLGGELAGRPWSALFPERLVRAEPGEPVVLIELTPAPGVPSRILQDLLFRRAPGFLAWGV